jgi:phosphopantothenate synthetase
MRLEMHRIDRMSDDEHIDELKEVVKLYSNFKFTRHEFDKIAKKCKGIVVFARFG